MTTHIVIKSENYIDFQTKLNEVSAANNVFATQTHTPVENGKIVYIAIFFIRDK